MLKSIVVFVLMSVVKMLKISNVKCYYLRVCSKTGLINVFRACLHDCLLQQATMHQSLMSFCRCLQKLDIYLAYL